MGRPRGRSVSLFASDGRLEARERTAGSGAGTLGAVPDPSRPRAVVTGASIGIGRAFAEELARRGFDLVVVARNEQQLTQLSTALASRHGTEVTVLAADLSTGEGTGRVAHLLSGEERVDLLVNNAGRGVHGLFSEQSLEDELGQIDLNVRALVHLTRAALPGMISRGSGAVLNVASTAAFQPVPEETVYAATKAFVLSFSEGLHEEVRRRGVVVTALCPGFTRTEFQERAGVGERHLPSFLWQEAHEVAAAGLDAVEAKRAVVTPGVHNRALGVVTRLAPRSIVRKGAGFAATFLRGDKSD